jgi:hypothetical protein
MDRPTRFFLVSLALAAACGALNIEPLAAGETIKTISTRPGVTLSFVLSKPAQKPRGVVILLAGSSGQLELSPSGIDAAAAQNFVVRTRQQYVAAGFVTAVPDSPSDRPNGLEGFRSTAPHAEDMKQLIAWLRAKWSVPVWMVGTSRGTISVANAAARLGASAGPDGIVLTSSVTVAVNAKESLGDVAVENIRVPAGVLHNKKDACKASPFAGAQSLSLPRAARYAFQAFDGGAMPSTDACGALSYHGFYGLDSEVVNAVVAFIGG